MLTVEVSGEDHDVAGALHLAANFVWHRTYTLEDSEGTIVEVQIEKAKFAGVCVQCHMGELKLKAGC